MPHALGDMSCYVGAWVREMAAAFFIIVERRAGEDGWVGEDPVTASIGLGGRG
jgi:hypothetical protein